MSIQHTDGANITDGGTCPVHQTINDTNILVCVYLLLKN